MHFSISDTQKLKETNGSTFVAYNLQINGVFHCSVRYKQLHSLHQQLCHEFGSSTMPSFPPKKFFSLSSSQVEERRINLERYVLQLSQDTRILNSDTFNGWLVFAQNETQRSGGPIDDVQIDVYLMDGQRYNFRISPTLQTNDLLEKVCQQLNLPSHLVYYFGLYLVKKDEKKFVVIKELQDFESPYISQKCSRIPLKIMLRKNCWEPGDDETISEDRCGLNLVYMQAVAEIQKGWVEATMENMRQLTTFQARGAKKEYLELARTLRFYGYVQFNECICNFPEPNTPVLIAAGNRELSFRINYGEESYRDGSFKVIKMKCWRISTLTDDDTGNDSQQLIPSINSNASLSHNGLPKNLELSFEYLITKNDLRWIRIRSPQAVVMSLCLQGMVRQLLATKEGTRFKTPMNRVRKGSLSYMKRDGSSMRVTLNHTGEPLLNFASGMSPIGELSWRSLSQRLSDFSLLENHSSRPQSDACSFNDSGVVENSAFSSSPPDDLF